jgi:hypothetical protein
MDKASVCRSRPDYKSPMADVIRADASATARYRTFTSSSSNTRKEFAGMAPSPASLSP